MIATPKLPLWETKRALQTLGRTPGTAKPPRSPKARLATARGPLEVGCQALAPCLATPQRGWPPNTTPWQCLTPRRAPGQSRPTPSLRRKLPPILATTSQPRSTSDKMPFTERPKAAGVGRVETTITLPLQCHTSDPGRGTRDGQVLPAGPAVARPARGAKTPARPCPSLAPTGANSWGCNPWPQTL